MMNNKIDKQQAKEMLQQEKLPQFLLEKQQKEIGKMKKKMIIWSTQFLWGLAAFMCMAIGWTFLRVSINIIEYKVSCLTLSTIFLSLAVIFSFYTARTQYGLRFQSILIMAIIGIFSTMIVHIFGKVAEDPKEWYLKVIATSFLVMIYAVIPMMVVFIKNSVNQIQKEIKEFRFELADMREKMEKDTTV